MQTNILMNILMSSPGGTALIPPSSTLLGAQASIASAGNTLGNTLGTTSSQFAGLLGQPGKASDLALLPTTTTPPTGDTETSPQAVGIALPGLAAYIDQQTPPVLQNIVTLKPDTGNTLDSKKATVASNVLANISGKASIVGANQASDVVNQQDFQTALKNIKAQKQADGQIKLPALPADMKAAADSSPDIQSIMDKLAAAANTAGQPVKTDATAIKTTTATPGTATATAATDATATDKANGKVQNVADAADDNLANQGNNLISKFKLAEVAKAGVKDAVKDKTLNVEAAPNTTVANAQTAQTNLKDVKIDAKTADAATIQTASNQVEVKIAQMVKDGVDMVRIKLHPEELGKIDIQMNVGSDGKTAIHVIADKVETLDMLRRDSHSLEKALKDTGVRTDAGSLQFSLRDSGTQQQNFANNSGKYPTYTTAQVNDNYLKAANVNEYTLSMNPQQTGVNILA